MKGGSMKRSVLSIYFAMLMCVAWAALTCAAVPGSPSDPTEGNKKPVLSTDGTVVGAGVPAATDAPGVPLMHKEGPGTPGTGNQPIPPQVRREMFTILIEMRDIERQTVTSDQELQKMQKQFMERLTQKLNDNTRYQTLMGRLKEIQKQFPETTGWNSMPRPKMDPAAPRRPAEK
jgi:hypothetical protein